MPKKPTERFDVAVVSSDPTALVAAWECARIGLRVVVLELPDAPLAENQSNTGKIFADLCGDVGISVTTHTPEPGTENLYGIPANPFSAAVREVLGWRGAWRIYLDRLMPIMSVGNERSLLRLVRRRLGARALRLLVQPRLVSDLGLRGDVDVVDLIPGLGEATTRVGSLTLGVIEMMAADVTVVQSVRVDGGMLVLWSALRERLDYFAVTRRDAKDVEVTAGTATDDVLVRFTAADGQSSSFTAGSLLATREIVEEVSSHELPTGVVGIHNRAPSMAAALAASRHEAAQVRQALLSRAEKPPVGPVDLGG